MLFCTSPDNFDQIKVLFETLINHAVLRSIECKVQSLALSKGISQTKKPLEAHPKRDEAVIKQHGSSCSPMTFASIDHYIDLLRAYKFG
jgi:hypothetical protein